MTHPAAPTAPALTAGSARAWVVPGLLILSGAAGLGHQIVWIRLLAVGLGAEAAAALSVVGAFLAGLAIGAWASDGLAARVRRPGLVYAALEALVALWALALIWLAGPTADLALGLAGPEPSAARQVVVSAALPFLLLAPATVAMGAALPFAEALHERLTGSRRSVGALVGANALGAALGAWGTLALVAPRAGLHGAMIALAAAGFLAAAGAWAASRAAGPQIPSRAVGGRPGAALLATLAVTGLLGIGLEVVLIRGLAQTLEGTVYSFAATVAVYLLGAAAGGALAQGRDAAPGALMAGLALASAWAAAGLPWAPDAYGALGGGRAAEWAVTAALFAPAAVLMGWLFAALAQAARGPSGGLGAALAVNLLGGALAPVVVGLALIPMLGTVRAGLALAAGYAALAALHHRPRAAAAGALAAALALLAPPALVHMLPGERIVFHREGAQSSATVLEDRAGERRLLADGRFAMGGTATEATDRLQGHVPLLLHPAPRSALFLGLGSGATAAAAADHPGLDALAVELSGPVIAAVPALEAADLSSDLGAVRVIRGDARRLVRASGAAYDVIVADTFHPARDGAALLYTAEHFEAVRDRLAPGGLFAQWIPLHQFDLPMLAIVTATFLDTFPDARLHVANANLGTPLVALIGGGAAPSPEALMGRVRDRALGREIARLGLGTPLALMGGHVAGPDALRVFAEGAPLNRDADPRLLFAAPASVYEPLGPAANRLLALLDLPRAPGRALSLGPSARDAAFAEALGRYWAARDAFVRLGAQARLTGDPARDAVTLGPRLAEIAALSPDYAPALRPLTAMGIALAGSDPEAARALLLPAASAGHAPARDALERLR